jgi:hypothetical protein
MIGSRYALAALAASICLSPAIAQELRLSIVTEAAKSVVIRGHVRLNKNCEAIEPPALLLDKSPDHGTVCSRPGSVFLKEILYGEKTQRCLGHNLRGIKVVYLPRWGYAGADGFRYTVVHPAGQYPVIVDITVRPNRPNSTGLVPPDISSPTAEELQSPGPIPACTALSS